MGRKLRAEAPFNAHSVQDKDDAFSQEHLEAWFQPLWSCAHLHLAQMHQSPSAEAQRPSPGQFPSVQMCLAGCEWRCACVHVCVWPARLTLGRPPLQPLTFSGFGSCVGTKGLKQRGSCPKHLHSHSPAPIAGL